MSKVLAVGDVHTKTWMIYEISELIDHYDKIIFVGDYADNWGAPPTHTMSCWRLIRQLMQAHPKKVFAVIGNHDYAYIHPEIAGRSSGWNPVTYTLINTPENKKIKDWLLSLPAILNIDGVYYSHAGITEEYAPKHEVFDGTVQGLWNDVSPLWARPPKFGGRVTYKNGYTQVIGHNPSETIWNPAPDVWCIDTFSQDQNNNFIGDKTLLEIVDGKEFNIIKLEDIQNENNNDTSGVEDQVS